MLSSLQASLLVLTSTRETQSLTPSLRDVLHEFGRTYNKWKLGGRHMLAIELSCIVLTGMQRIHSRTMRYACISSSRGHELIVPSD